MPDLECRAGSQGMLHQCCRDPLAMISERNIITDLCSKAECRTTRPVGTEAAPASDVSFYISDKDGLYIRPMFPKPPHSVCDPHRLRISRGLLRWDRLVVNLHNCGKIVKLRESDDHPFPFLYLELYLSQFS